MEEEPQLFILEETLKVKQISYQIYRNLRDLEASNLTVESTVVVTDYIFQH